MSYVKIVKTRKPHKCEVCGEVIPRGVKALRVNFYSYWHGWMNYYVHLEFPCIREWMEKCSVSPNSIEGKTILKEVSR